MSDIKENQGLSDKDYLLAENILKISAIQKLLIKKGLLTEQEIIDEMTNISKEIEKIMNEQVEKMS